MTGYGVAEGSVSGGVLQVELRTVNHKHFTANLKLTSALQQLESPVRDVLRGEISRGHLSLSCRWVEEPERPIAMQVNLDKAREAVAVLSRLKQALDLPGEVDLAFVARQPEVLTAGSTAQPTVDENEVLAVAREALAGLVAMRKREGAALGAELESLLTALATGLTVVEDQAPERLTVERDRLTQSVAELLDGRAVDEQRLAQEIAIIADRLDITEETVRLRTHIDAFAEALSGDGPMGRHLSFLGQEMLREINTIGSKANDAVIAHEVIAMKGTVEKIREQLENVE